MRYKVITRGAPAVRNSRPLGRHTAGTSDTQARVLDFCTPDAHFLEYRWGAPPSERSAARMDELVSSNTPEFVVTLARALKEWAYVHPDEILRPEVDRFNFKDSGAEDNGSENDIASIRRPRRRWPIAFAGTTGPTVSFRLTEAIYR